MATREQLPAPNRMIRELNSPNHGRGFYRELVARDSPRFQQLSPIKRGSLYSECNGGDKRVTDLFPQLYFLKETVPIGSNTVAGMTQSDWVVWNWATDALADSSFNAEISYLGDSITNPVFARIYDVRRDEYEANPTIAPGTPLTALLGVRVDSGGYGYTRAVARFSGPGADSGAEVEFVIADGAITSAIVTKEGSGFTTDGNIISKIEVDGDGTGADLSCIVQPVAAILTSQKKMEFPDGDPMSHEFVRVLRVYELLPGPWIPFTRYDDDLGPIQGRRRAVRNTGQLGGAITATGKRNYEGRDGSSVVSIEIEENFSNGTGIPGPRGEPNPPYPILVLDDYDRTGEGRGAYQRTSQIVVATGNEVASLTRNAGIVTKTTYEPYVDNPFLLRKLIETWTEVIINDKRLIHEFGGAIVDVGETTDAPGVQSPEHGLMIVSSETRQISPAEQKKIQVKNPLSAWPILPGRHTDDVTGIVIEFTKQVVDANTPYPGRSGYRGPFVELQPYDFDKAFQIISRVDLSTLPGPEAWPTTINFPFPPVLLSIEAIWSNFVGKSAEATDDNISVSVHSGSGGGVIVTARKARARIKAIQARDYFYGSPPQSAVPTPFEIMTSAGSVVITQTDSNTFLSGNDEQTGLIGSNASQAFSFNGGRVGDNFSNQVKEIDIPHHIVGPNVQIINPVHISQAVSAIGISGGGRTRSVGALGTRSFMEVRIPLSTPAQLTPGQQFLADVDVREWRGGHGIWIVDRFYGIVP